MKKPEENEQWLLNGNCDICRRKNYCKKDCTKKTRAKDAFLRSAVRSAVDEVTGGAFSEILSHSRYQF